MSKSVQIQFAQLALTALVAEALLLGQSTSSASLPPAATIKVDYDQQIKPLLAAKCYSCHGDQVTQAGLRLDRRQQALRGGDYGPVIQVGDSANSKLIRRLVNGDGGLRMPPTEPLTNDEIGLLRAWIDQGADFRIEISEEAPPKPIDPRLASLLKAIRSRDLTAVETMLKADRALVQMRDAAKSTALHHAAAFGSIAIMKALIENGADVNAANRRLSTPIFWALHDGERVRLLLDKGAKVNVRLIEGTSLLYQVSTLNNSAPLLALLLEKGADPNFVTATGQTPLMAVAGRGNVESMRLLLAKNVDIHKKNGAGGTALIAAANSGNPLAVRILLEKGADPNVVTKRGDTALNAAATQGVEDSVRLLLDRGAKVNNQDEHGYSPLMHAAASDANSVATVKLLLAKGADPKLSAEYEYTAASLAAKHGDTEISRLLGVPERERQLGGVVAQNVGNVVPLSPKQAVEKALPLLEKQSYNFIRIGGCNSCHSQDLSSAASGLARTRGIPGPRLIPQLPISMTGVPPERVMDLGAGAIGSMGWELFDLGLNQMRQSDYTDAVIFYIRAMQTAEGYWTTPQARRPPMNNGEVQTAALAIFALNRYSPEASRTESELAVSKARAWLEKQHPQSNQDLAFQVMGLVWANASPDTIRRAARALAETQRPEGGWAQMQGMGSDAYATGQALYALNTAGIAPREPGIRKGVSYLLRTQAADGSWHVKTRSIWLQPYFESGFPYGTDQFISAAGTAWASIALSVAEPPAPTTSTIAKK